MNNIAANAKKSSSTHSIRCRILNGNDDVVESALREKLKLVVQQRVWRECFPKHDSEFSECHSELVCPNTVMVIVPQSGTRQFEGTIRCIAGTDGHEFDLLLVSLARTNDEFVLVYGVDVKS